MSPATPSHARGRSRRLDVLANVGLVLGLVILAALWGGPLATMARTAFSPHMMLHLGVMIIAAPMISFWLSRRLRGTREFRDALNWVMLASVFDLVAVWGWHIPVLHAMAERHDGLFVVQQGFFLAAGLAVWTAAMSARTRHAAGAGAIGLFFTFTHMTMFGLVITITPRLIYAPDICRGAWGFTPLNDQQFGGILMATFGGLPYLAGAALAVFRFVAPEGEPTTNARAG